MTTKMERLLKILRKDRDDAHSLGMSYKKLYDEASNTGQRIEFSGDASKYFAISQCLECVAQAFEEVLTSEESDNEST